MSPLAGAPTTATELTVGVVAVVPTTRWPDALEMAWLPRSRFAAAPAVLRIVPPFSCRAVVLMLIPSGSRSRLVTTYPKCSDWPDVLRNVANAGPPPKAICNRGLPTTRIGTAAANSTATSISSPPPYTWALNEGELVMRTPLTLGTVAEAPFTLWLALAEKAAAPRPSPAFRVPPTSLIVPPLSASALAATPIPSTSESPACTTYRKRMLFDPTLS